MNIFKKINQGLEEYRKEAEVREDKRLEKLKTKEGRAKARGEIEKTRLKRDKEIYEAKTATRKAQTAARKARLELEQLGGESGLSRLMNRLTSTTSHKAKRRKSKRR